MRRGTIQYMQYILYVRRGSRTCSKRSSNNTALKGLSCHGSLVVLYIVESSRGLALQRSLPGATMTLYTPKRAMWLLLLLLWTSREHVGARPVRGTVSYKPQLPLFRRQLQKMEAETPSPTWSPSLAPSRYPTIDPTASPTVVPTGTRTFAPSTSPTTLPATDTDAPTSQPTTIAATPTNVPATVAPTPSERPPAVAPPTDSQPPTDAALFRVPLADFQLQYQGVDGEGIQAVLEQYLADSMKLDYLVGVELSDVSRRRRRLQKGSSAKSLSGNATFGDLPVPSLGDVQAQQTVALEDTAALQQAFNDANLDVTVEGVVIEESATSTTSTDKSGLIAGIFVAAMVVISLAAFVGYRRWFSSGDDADKHVVEHSIEHVHIHEKDLVKYTPDDFEPAITTSKSVDVEEEGLPEGLDASFPNMEDEYSLSAASADSSVKKNHEQRRQSLLQRLALYQKTELKSPPKKKNDEVPMPAALFVPRAAQSNSTHGEDVPRAPTPTHVDGATTPTKRNVSTAAATSLLQKYDDDVESEEGTEVDLLPPPPMSDSSDSPPRIFQDHHQQQQQPMVVAPQAKKSNDFSSVLARLSRQRTPPRAGTVVKSPPETVAKHDFPSTTWQHPPVIVKPVVTKAYSDGPSDELNFELEQDLTNFGLPAVVSPEPPSPPRIIRGRASPPPSPPPPPPPPRFKNS